jgi:hypothetical protein
MESAATITISPLDTEDGRQLHLAKFRMSQLEALIRRVSAVHQVMFTRDTFRKKANAIAWINANWTVVKPILDKKYPRRTYVTTDRDDRLRRHSQKAR